MAKLKPGEVAEVARKMRDTPNALGPVADAIDQVARDTGFADLDDDDLVELLRALVTDDTQGAHMVFAGAGAQCCSTRCETQGDR